MRRVISFEMARKLVDAGVEMTTDLAYDGGGYLRQSIEIAGREGFYPAPDCGELLRAAPEGWAVYRYIRVWDVREIYHENRPVMMGFPTCKTPEDALALALIESKKGG